MHHIALQASRRLGRLLRATGAVDADAEALTEEAKALWARGELQLALSMLERLCANLNGATSTSQMVGCGWTFIVYCGSYKEKTRESTRSAGSAAQARCERHGTHSFSLSCSYQPASEAQAMIQLGLWKSKLRTAEPTTIVERQIQPALACLESHARGCATAEVQLEGEQIAGTLPQTLRAQPKNASRFCFVACFPFPPLVSHVPP